MPAFWRTSPPGPPTPSLSGGDNRIKERAASTTRPTSPLLQQPSSPYNIRPPQDNLNNLVNGLAKEYNYNGTNENSENVIDKSKAENYNDRSDGSGDTDDDDARDGDSSDSDEGNEAYGCVGRRGSLAPISSGLKPKHAAKHRL